MTNTVESINRQSKNNLNVILENIYLEDRDCAVKMAARCRDFNITHLTHNIKAIAQVLWKGGTN